MQKSKKLKLEILHDAEKNKAYVVGNQGVEEVVSIAGYKVISFIEITSTKSIITTTIVNKKKTVHSRNTTLLGELIASQYYGSCKIFER